MSKVLIARVSFVAACAVAWSACSVQDTTIPDLAGPSGFAQSLSLSVTPDNITEDGSQSVVVATLLKADGSPASNVALKLTTSVNGSSVDFGVLSSRTIYTDASGKAATVYTAPVASAFFYGGPSKLLAIEVVPVGSNYDVSSPPFQRATIKITPPPTTPQPGAPQASVTYTPAAPKVGQVINFDASESQAASGHTNVNYFWDFGDGRAHDEHGNDASHTYSAAGTYTVTLGVQDDAGRIASTFRTIVVTK